MTDVETEVKLKWEAEQVSLKTRLELADRIDFTIDPSLIRDVQDLTDLKQEERNAPTAGLNFLGGVDVSFIPGNDTQAYASFVILEFSTLDVVYQDIQLVELNQPYLVGFLAFREASVLIPLIEKARCLDCFPQVVLFDGNGILHPRGLGIASHAGILMDLPTIGVAKNLLLVDGLEREQIQKRCDDQLKRSGDYLRLIGDSKTCWGAALRTSDSGKNPVFVSIGHRISLETALAVVQACSSYRIPEPIRQADLRSRKYIRELEEHSFELIH
jgi:deoxyinosine 3'endonuclease (endonuclease V)